MDDDDFHANGRAAAARRRTRFGGSGFFRDQDGATAAEFALVTMPMVILTFAIIAFGSLLFIWNEMKGAARESVRCASVADTVMDGTAQQCGGHISGSAEDIACNILADWWPTFTVSMSQTAVAGGNDFDVTITAPMDEAMLVDIFGFAAGRTLSASASIRQEIPPLSAPGPGC
jgi:Flp pilus assembly pilin Flp